LFADWCSPAISVDVLDYIRDNEPERYRQMLDGEEIGYKSVVQRYKDIESEVNQLRLDPCPSVIIRPERIGFRPGRKKLDDYLASLKAK